MEEIIIRNGYVSYLLGLNGSEDSVEFFTYVNDEKTLSIFKYDENIPKYLQFQLQPYSVSILKTSYGGLETQYLLGLWISKATKITFVHEYTFDKERIAYIMAKPNYKKVEEEAVKELARIYNETQRILLSMVDENDEISLYRSITERDYNIYKELGFFKFNYITSFLSKGINKVYPGHVCSTLINIKRKNIFCYSNIRYTGYSLEELENEVLVIGL